MEEEIENWLFLRPEEINELVDGEYYWIAYQFTSAIEDDETWAIGKYNKNFMQFDLCERITITTKYVIEAQKVEPPH